MSFKTTHDLHRQRLGRNLALGLVLVSFVALVFGWTVTKVTNPAFRMPSAEELE
jgi:hypothetical protein